MHGHLGQLQQQLIFDQIQQPDPPPLLHKTGIEGVRKLRCLIVPLHKGNGDLGVHAMNHRLEATLALQPELRTDTTGHHRATLFIPGKAQVEDGLSGILPQAFPQAGHTLQREDAPLDHFPEVGETPGIQMIR